jgi:hypothetical protein
LAAALVAFASSSSRAEPVVPGTGRALPQVGDDFEDTTWEYQSNPPKSTQDLDRLERYPHGESRNGRWYEGMKRGHPDVVQRVETPPGGLPGSRSSLLLQSLWTGIPGRASDRMQQDDLIADVNYRLGGVIPAAFTPSVVVRVFLPPAETWENRSGPHFGFRTALLTTVRNPQPSPFVSGSQPRQEAYWPGMFIEFQSKTDGYDNDYAHFRVRADQRGGDFVSKPIATTGWWTLGISISPDGMVHYYASPGIDDLTQRDHLSSHYPYGYRTEHFKTFFFNVCSGDDGRTWSTPWVIDDPTVYVVP